MIVVIAFVMMLAVSCFTWIAFISIQEGQWLGVWQKVLYKLDMKGHSNLIKPLGACEVCFSHLLAFIGYWFYVLVCVGYYDIWFEKWTVFMSIISYLTFIPITTALSTYLITKAFNR